MGVEKEKFKIRWLKFFKFLENYKPIEIQYAQQNPSRHIIIKLLNTSDKKTDLKATRGEKKKRHIT